VIVVEGNMNLFGFLCEPPNARRYASNLVV
jgi:hypothetical protein